MVHNVPLAFTLICFALIISAVEAHGQLPAPSSYLFVNIKDTSGRPVTDATIQVYGADGKQITGRFASTDGRVSIHFPIRSDHHYNVLVSKQGFQLSEHVFFSRPSGYGVTLFEKMERDYLPELGSIILRKRPTTESEQKVFDAQELQTQMILAAKRCDLLRISKLLWLGVSADAVDADGVSALLWAAFAGDADTINALLEAGAHVRTKNPRDAKALLIYLAEGIVREQKGRTSPAEIGEGMRRGAIVQDLIKAGADVNAKDPYLGTVLNAALRVISTLAPWAIGDLVKAGANVNTPDEPQRSTPLMWASQSRSSESVKTLLAAGASVDVKDKAGRTALMWAQVARQGPNTDNPEIESALIRAGANVNVTDENGYTPLILAAQADLTESVKMLVTAGGHVNAKNKWGDTPLISALYSYYYLQADTKTHHPVPLTIRTLLAAGADIHAGNAEGKTPLMLAARTDSLEVVKMLLEAGARIDARDKKGQTALMYERFTYAPSFETFKILVAAKGDVNAIDPGGRTPLMCAALGAPPEIFALLLESGAKTSVNARDNSGQTALMYAVYYSNYDFTPEDQLRNVRALLQAGADVNIKDISGKTALSIAQAYSSRNQALIELLKSKSPN